MTDFANWLEDEMKRRGWHPADLAKAAGLYQSTLGNVLNRERSAGADVCTALARALKLPPEEVFRRAGLLPELPAPDNDITLKRLYEYVKRLSPDDRLLVLDYAFHRYKRAQGAYGTLTSDETIPANGNDAAKAAA